MRSHASSCPLQSFQNEQAMARGLFRQNRLSSAVTLRLRWRTVTTQPAQLWPTMLRDALPAARKDRDTARDSALGAAEVARRELSDAQIRGLVRAEVDERLTAARDFTAAGHTERAATLRAEAAVLSDLLGDV